MDPLLAQTGQPYSYAGDNPANATDPSGACWTMNANRSMLLWYLRIGGDQRCGDQERRIIFNSNLRSDHSYLLVGAAPAALDALAGSAAIAEALRIVARADLATGDGVLLGVAADSVAGATADEVAVVAADEAVALATGETCAEAAAAVAVGISTGGVALVVIGVVGVVLILVGAGETAAHFDQGPQYPVAPEPAPTPGAQTQPAPSPTPGATATGQRGRGEVLYHYTDAAGADGIVKSEVILSSSEHATFGAGQYFSDLPPTGLLTQKEYSNSLFRSSNVQQKVTNWVAIDVSGLAVVRAGNIYKDKIAAARRPAVAMYGIWLHPSAESLSVAGRIIDAGTTKFAQQ